MNMSLWFLLKGNTGAPVPGKDKPEMLVRNQESTKMKPHQEVSQTALRTLTHKTLNLGKPQIILFLFRVQDLQPNKELAAKLCSLTCASAEMPAGSWWRVWATTDLLSAWRRVQDRTFSWGQEGAGVKCCHVPLTLHCKNTERMFTYRAQPTQREVCKEDSRPPYNGSHIFAAVMYPTGELVFIIIIQSNFQRQVKDLGLLLPYPSNPSHQPRSTR